MWCGVAKFKLQSGDDGNRKLANAAVDGEGGGESKLTPIRDRSQNPHTISTNTKLFRYGKRKLFAIRVANEVANLHGNF